MTSATFLSSVLFSRISGFLTFLSLAPLSFIISGDGWVPSGSAWLPGGYLLAGAYLEFSKRIVLPVYLYGSRNYTVDRGLGFAAIGFSITAGIGVLSLLNQVKYGYSEIAVESVRLFLLMSLLAFLVALLKGQASVLPRVSGRGMLTPPPEGGDERGRSDQRCP